MHTRCLGPVPTAGFAIWLTCTCSSRQVLSMSPFVPKPYGKHSSGAILIRFSKSWLLRQRIGSCPFEFLQKSAGSTSDTVRRSMRCTVSGQHCDRTVSKPDLLRRLGLTVERKQTPQIVVNSGNRREAIEPKEAATLPWAQGVGRSNRPAPTKALANFSLLVHRNAPVSSPTPFAGRRHSINCSTMVP